MKIFTFHFTVFILLARCFLHCQGLAHYKFVVVETPITRLCSSKTILTVNGQFPGPTLYANKGDTIIVDVFNKAKDNITIHWHGVRQPRNPWTDGPEYITQCPIQPGGRFRQTIILSDEEGTLWWHAHSEWSRATVHGAFVIYPKIGTTYPFPKPYEEVPIIIGEWLKQDIDKIYQELLQTGGGPNSSDAYTINGQPGDLYPCSKQGTFNLMVEYGKTYLLRIINAAIEDIIFFGIANHNLIVVGSDASYTKPLTSQYIAISPGQTIDALFEANQPSDRRYYMSAQKYNPINNLTNISATSIIQYKNSISLNSSILLPRLPISNDTSASFNFTSSLRSLVDPDHPVDVPLNITNNMLVTISVNTLPCSNNSCFGPNGTRFFSSLNNISFVSPSVDLLEAYFYHKNGIFTTNFPSFPPLVFDFTAEYLPLYLETPKLGTEVHLLDYNSTVEIVFQGTNVAAGSDHPMHLHGYSFYVVGQGLGNFNKEEDPLGYNLIDPPRQNTIVVPINGWTTIRFKADNPGVWFLHCHFDRHITWGMKMAFIVKDGNSTESSMLPPPQDMPPC